jgi:hypothetical protein
MQANTELAWGPGLRSTIISKNKGDVVRSNVSLGMSWWLYYKLSDYALPALNPACSICSRAASAVEWMPCTLSLKSSGLLAFSKAVS